MKTFDETGLLDTNIIIYAHDVLSPFHRRALRFFEDAINGRIPCALTPQVLLEFVAVVTNPRRVFKPLDISEAVECARLLWHQGKVERILPLSSTLPLALELAHNASLRGAQIFDAFLVATALDNGVNLIYTVNVDDFRFLPIRAENPLM